MASHLLTKDHVKIFKGKYYLPWFKKPDVIHFKTPNKVVVFDLDETLGSFADLYILWRGIKHVWPSCSAFDELCNLYPEFLRYGILTILEYLYDKKIKKECHKIFIYTNNQCSSEWVTMISKYLETKVKHSFGNKSTHVLFDKSICAFKINNKQIEPSRTGHSKKVDDFIRCSLVSENADICFVDDVEYPAMKSAKVYYICPRPYIHTLSTNAIIKRLTQSSWIRPGLLSNESFWSDWFQIHLYNRRTGSAELELDLQVSQKIIYHLREFMMFGLKNKPGGKITNRNKIRISGTRETKKLKLK
jgi:hypothetical protein